MRPLNLAVWIYWEGPQPYWIQLCRKTILAHYSNVRSLTPKTFDDLRDRDRDIDLSRLSIVHRADFIRSFLLARFGGVWIDSDCIVMKDLQHWVNALNSYEFFGYKERAEPWVTNSFIGAQPGSKIASDFYHRNCDILRSAGTLGWTTLGADTLSETIKSVRRPWLRIGYELIQPVCWSRPELFFARRSDNAHEAQFNHRSVCYMLSKTSIDRFTRDNPARRLLARDTFFAFLYRRAMKPKKCHTLILPSSKISSWDHIPFCAKLLKQINPLSVIDTDVGFGRWAVLVREVCEYERGRIHREDWRIKVEGLMASLTDAEEYHDHLYDRIHFEPVEDFLCNHKFELAFVTNKSGLEAAIHSCDYVIAVGDFRYKNLSFRPRRHKSFEADSKRYEAALFSRNDPKNLM